MAIDTLILGARDPVSGEAMDVGMEAGKVCYFEPSASATSRPEASDTLEASGWMLLPGLVETHIHLDKAFLSERLPRAAAHVQDAIAMTAALKPAFTTLDISERSERVIARAIQFGVTLMRAHVELDPILGWISMASALEMKQKYAQALDLQLVAFPQEGIFTQPGTEQLLREAAMQGVDAIGGVPYNDRDSLAHLEWVFRLAAESGLPLDLHLDFSDDPAQLAILDVIALTQRFGMKGRVAVGHLTSLGSVEPDCVRRIAAGMAEAGIHVFALPATDLYLNGRGDTHRVRRGITPVRLLLEAGVNVCFGTNNLRNAFTPFGTGDPLDIAYLLAQTTYMGSEADAHLLLEMCTKRARTALGVAASELRNGAAGDLLLVRAESVQDLIYDRPRERMLWRGGRRIAYTQ